MGYTCWVRHRTKSSGETLHPLDKLADRQDRLQRKIDNLQAKWPFGVDPLSPDLDELHKLYQKMDRVCEELKEFTGK